MPHSTKRKLTAIIVGVVGYILSPLSWWNDPIVNVPISLACGYAAERVVGVRAVFPLAFEACYLATNMLGLLLMGAAGYLASSKRPSLWKLIVTSLVYTIIASAVAKVLGLW